MSRVTLPFEHLLDIVSHVVDEYGDSVPLELFQVSISEFEDHFIVKVSLVTDGEGIRSKNSLPL